MKKLTLFILLVVFVISGLVFVENTNQINADSALFHTQPLGDRLGWYGWQRRLVTLTSTLGQPVTGSVSAGSSRSAPASGGRC